jgi:hypothetical protein
MEASVDVKDEQMAQAQKNEVNSLTERMLHRMQLIHVQKTCHHTV